MRLLGSRGRRIGIEGRGLLERRLISSMGKNAFKSRAIFILSTVNSSERRFANYSII